LREITGADFTAKDFRTWAGTLSAARLLGDLPVATPQECAAVVKDVAKELGNTSAVCRRCYIHPLILTSAQDGRLRKSLRRLNRRAKSQRGLRRDEVALLKLLQL
jgi:DNA topoisomerase I